MGKQEELVKLDRIVKDLEIRAKTFTSGIDTLQKEISFLLNIEKQLEENLAYLKNEKIVALAKHYKNAKENLKRTRERIYLLNKDKDNSEKAYLDVNKLLTKNKETYDKLSKQSENNVLQGKFGKKRG